MITSNYIVFSHGRLGTQKVGQSVVTGPIAIKTLPVFAIKSIAVSKQAVKEYLPYDNTKSMYLPTAMIGPTIKMICEVEATEQNLLDDSKIYTLQEYQLGSATADGIYTNDILTVVSFGYPTWNAVLYNGSQWWVDTITYTAKVGSRRHGTVSHEIELTIYRRDV